MDRLVIFGIVLDTRYGKPQADPKMVEMQNLAMRNGYAVSDTGRLDMFSAPDGPFEPVDIGQVMKD